MPREWYALIHEHTSFHLDPLKVSFTDGFQVGVPSLLTLIYQITLNRYRRYRVANHIVGPQCSYGITLFLTVILEHPTK